MRIGLHIAFACAALLLAGCFKATSPIKAISDEVEKYGFTVYNPPRSNRGPGWVFQLVKTFDGKTVPGTVCENLFPDDRSIEGKMSLPNIETRDNSDIAFSLGLLEGLLNNVQKASADLSAKSVKTLTIKWGPVKARELPQERKFDEQGKKLPIGKACSAALRELKNKNAMGTVFVVQEAAVAESMTVSVEQERNTGASLDASLYNVLTVKPGAKVSEKSNSSIEVSDPRYVGFIAVAVLDWVALNELGDETANVVGRLINRQELDRLMR